MSPFPILVSCSLALAASLLQERASALAPQDPKPAAANFSPAQQKAYAWLMTQQKDGVFTVSMRGRAVSDPGLSGFGVLALQTKPKELRTPEEQKAVDQGIAWLLTQQNPDGTFGQRVPNYTTCVAVAALSRSTDAKVKAALEKAQKVVLGFQHLEQSGFSAKDADYGSIGYGGTDRGDLSNLAFSLEAFHATGLPGNHEAFQKAIVFLQRTQNLKSVNDFTGKIKDPENKDAMVDVTSGDDGGAFYYPGNSPAGYTKQPDGKIVPRSYGSMTYALLKSYTFAGLKGDDPRVQAAVGWIKSNWDLSCNPGADPTRGENEKFHGLYYSYMLLAQALSLAGIDTIEPVSKGDAKQAPIDWRKALAAHLQSIQKDDGSWVNAKSNRWQEDLPLLCTCYALTALEQCAAPAPKTTPK